MPVHRPAGNRRRTTRIALAGTAAAALALGGLALLSSGAGAVDLSSQVVISEVYGGGGNTGAQYTNDFIELYNNGSTPVSVAGWSVQYASSTGTSWQKTALTGTVPAGGFYLIAEGAGAGNGAPLPTPNDTGTIALSATSGKVALVNNSTALTGCAAACSSAAGVVDFLGFGTANDAAGTPTPALSNTTSDQRKLSPFSNTGNNANDFSQSPRRPRRPAAAPRRRRPAASVPDPAGVRAGQYHHPGRPGHRLQVPADRPDRVQGGRHRHRDPDRRLVQGLLDPAGPAGHHPDQRLVRRVRVHLLGLGGGRRRRAGDRQGVGLLPAGLR